MGNKCGEVGFNNTQEYTDVVPETEFIIFPKLKGTFISMNDDTIKLNTENSFKALIENCPDIITRFDKQLRHIYVNPAVERTTGIPSDKWMGKKMIH